MKYQMILQSQQDFFRSGATLSISYRREVLSLAGRGHPEPSGADRIRLS